MIPARLRAAVDSTEHRPHVLVVDDDVALADYFALHLRMAGLDVSTAANGVTALATIVQKHPDIVVLDLDLPMLNGLQVHAALRQGDLMRELPIITVSGTDWKAPDDSVATLNKPIDGEAMVNTVLDALARGRGSDEMLPGLRAIVWLCPTCKRSLHISYERGNPATSEMRVDAHPCARCMEE